MKFFATIGAGRWSGFNALNTAAGCRYCYRIRSEPSSIDPYFHNLGPNNAMLGQIFDRLNDWTPKMDKMFGRAAKSWKAINETTWEYKLHKGIKFHDGSDLTADDVIFFLR